MKMEYDRKVDALYIRIQEKQVKQTKELEEGINLDFDEDGKIIGLEIIVRRTPSEGQRSDIAEMIFSTSRSKTLCSRKRQNHPNKMIK